MQNILLLPIEHSTWVYICGFYAQVSEKKYPERSNRYGGFGGGYYTVKRGKHFLYRWASSALFSTASYL